MRIGCSVRITARRPSVGDFYVNANTRYKGNTVLRLHDRHGSRKHKIAPGEENGFRAGNMWFYPYVVSEGVEHTTRPETRTEIDHHRERRR